MKLLFIIIIIIIVIVIIIIIIIIVIIIILANLDRQLTCYQTGSKENACKTMYACFTYVTKDDNGKTIQFSGCIEKKMFNEIVCKSRSLPNFHAKCCHHDLCNKDVILNLPKPNVTKPSVGRCDSQNKIIEC